MDDGPIRRSQRWIEVGVVELSGEYRITTESLQLSIPHRHDNFLLQFGSSFVGDWVIGIARRRLAVKAAIDVWGAD